MSKRFIYISLILIILAISFSSAFKTHKVNTEYNLIFTADNATNCSIQYVFYPDNTLSNYINKNMTKSYQVFTFTFSSSNFTKLGDTCIFYTCIDPSASPTTESGNTCITVTTTGKEVSLMQTYAYILFLVICFLLLLGSVKITVKNPYKNDLSDSDQYSLTKTDKLKYYLNLLKSKFWIVGVFGVYIFTLLFLAILNSLVYDLGLNELNKILIMVNQVLLWGAIPFLIFWLIYIIIYFFNATTLTMKQQFGSFKR